MELAYLYTKVRAEFGKHPTFKDVEARILESIPSTEAYKDDYIMKNPSVAELSTEVHFSEHEVNTERVSFKHTGLQHKEGGWPKDVDPTEKTDVDRFRKKAEKDENYKNAVKAIGPIIDRCLKQNNTIDIYGDYFADAHVGVDYSSEPPNAKGLAVFRDPSDVPRFATSIDWHPEGPQKIAVSYAILNFQDPRFQGSTRVPPQSYIWDTGNPNTPDREVLPTSPIVCMRFNPKSTETLIAGCYNGTLCYLDLRRSGSAPVETSIIEHSHHDPVYDVFWTSSKTGSSAASTSTDGQMLFWDVRKFKEPSDKLMLKNDKGQVLPGSCMEYNQEAGPTKYLVGTEVGVVLSVNLRNRKQNDGVSQFDSGSGKHHSPIYSIQRNPSQNKYFMTVGDWCAKIWTEDLKSPIMSTKYHGQYLTAGCWSPTRAGVFFVARMDGVVDIWDYFYRQNDMAYSHKVGEFGLASVSVQGNAQSGGRLVAVGDVGGTVSLLELCESLAVGQPKEKQAIASMFERETKREKNLEVRERDLKRKQQQSSGDDGEADKAEDGKDQKMEDLLKKVDAAFLTMIKEAEDDLSEQSEEHT
jgi:dynein intermediate chain 2